MDHEGSQKVCSLLACQTALCIHNEILNITDLCEERVYLGSQFWVTVMWSVGLIALGLW